MKTTESFSFIDSEFSYDDAKELLTELLRHKINFHKAKNYSSIIRYDKSDTDSQHKIDNLMNTKNKIATFFDAAKNENKRISIFSELKITIE